MDDRAGGLLRAGAGRLHGEKAPGERRRQPAAQSGESTAEEVAEKTGITLNVPITAVDVTYSYIDGDKEPLAQVSFVYQGQTYTYRGQKTQTVQDISGMYYEWTKTTNDSEDVPYTCYFTDEGQGMALWHTDGVSYTLGMTENVTEELLVTMYGIVTGEAE